MKKLLLICSTFFCSLLARNAYCQSLDDMIIDYGQNADRALSKYMDKATVTVTFRVSGIDSVHFFDKKHAVGVWGGHGKYYSSLECEGLRYADVINLNQGDSIEVTGLLSSTGASKGDNFKNVLLKNAKFIKVVYQDSDHIKMLEKEDACPTCDTGMKMYHDFMTAYKLNTLRAKRDYFNKPFTFYVQVSRFQSSPSNTNFIYQLYKGGIGCLVENEDDQPQQQAGSRHRMHSEMNSRRYCVAVYGLSEEESSSLNVNQKFKVRGLLTKSVFLEHANTSQSAFDLITLYKCSIVK